MTLVVSRKIDKNIHLGWISLLPYQIPVLSLTPQEIKNHIFLKFRKCLIAQF
ncbi:hypothetical protein Lmac_0049 [Legionella maceachernii]|uniref:Uncharacterized protein n=1 Tax=Legionella maceachernii TaxID=466 RepID=A0A0W0WI71_9GAMM|nr:hypothetical protein Lmac_0049 [Legionella maceachernii]SKA24548.1 hypothetical protein SAMN02745128_02785 [Legionella maceachernii]SUP04320.1 Uncharacterised protein [Legionella maceachernii]